MPDTPARRFMLESGPLAGRSFFVPEGRPAPVRIGLVGYLCEVRHFYALDHDALVGRFERTERLGPGFDANGSPVEECAHVRR